MATTSFRSLDPSVLLDGFEPDGEDVDATDAPDDDVEDHPVLVGVPRMGSHKGLRAWALGAREREKHDHQEERELDLPMHRQVDGHNSQDET